MDNGQFVLAAGVAQWSGVVASQGSKGLNSDNAFRIGKSMAIQVGLQGFEDYFLNPEIEKTFGSQESLAKTVASGVFNYMALFMVDNLLK